jgi:hypothetical protein
MNLNQQEQASAEDAQILELARRLEPLRFSPHAQAVLVRETAKVEAKQASECPNKTTIAPLAHLVSTEPQVF